MTTIVTERMELRIPNWVRDLQSFRRWVHDPAFPEKLPAWWIRGEMWIDFCPQEVFKHVQIKGAIYSGLLNDADVDDLGYFFSSGVFYSNASADLAGNPDGVFVTFGARESKRVQFVDVAKSGDFDEIQGSPDMILEVVNYSSVQKDTIDLFEPYWLANIPEYWLVNAYAKPLQFDIWKRGENGYVATRKRDGWVKSAVFDKSFRLSEKRDRREWPKYRLEVK